MIPAIGKVYLIGAGPGDPGLLTVKGREVLERADIVVYDRLAHPSLLDHTPPSAERVFAGKARGQQELTQDGINALLVECAQAGKLVARLKGGDPFVFGRGGEEALALARAGIPFEVVPGVSSAIAAPAYAGIPVTHRSIAAGFTVVSGSEDPSKPESSVRWEELGRSLAAHGGTLMTLMGWASIERILESLQGAGLSPDTPVALVQWGTWSRQRTVTGTAGDGRRYRPRRRTGRAGGGGHRRGGEPARRTGVVRQPPAVRQACAGHPLPHPGVADVPVAGGRRGDCPWSCQPSPSHRPRILNRWTRPLGGWDLSAGSSSPASMPSMQCSSGWTFRAKTPGAFGAARVGAIGPATAAALERRGIRPDFTPSRPVSSVALEELAGYDWNGVSVLLPAADIGRDELAEGLCRFGASVERVTAYRTITPPDAAQRARDAFAEGIDIVTFTSSSTVRNLLGLLGEDGPTFSSPPEGGNTRGGALSGSLVACIGPVTASTAREPGPARGHRGQRNTPSRGWLTP